MQWSSAFTPGTREGDLQISQLVRVLSDMTQTRCSGRHGSESSGARTGDRMQQGLAGNATACTLQATGGAYQSCTSPQFAHIEGLQAKPCDATEHFSGTDEVLVQPVKCL